MTNNGGLGEYFVNIDLSDIENYDYSLCQRIREMPLSHINNLEKATSDLYGEYNQNFNPDELDFQIQITSKENAKPLRALKSKDIGKLINVNGIIINAGKTLLRGRKVKLRCRSCGHEMTVIVEKGLSGINVPFFCQRNDGQT